MQLKRGTHLDTSDFATLSSEIRPTCSIQHLIIKEVSGRLSFFTLRLFERRKVDRSPRCEALTKLFPHYVKELKKTGVTRHILWEEYIRKYSDGYSYLQFCYHFQIWRNASEVTMHIDHKAGDKMFVDYAGVKMSITDRKSGKEEPVEVFVAILGASQYTY